MTILECIHIRFLSSAASVQWMEGKDFVDCKLLILLLFASSGGGSTSRIQGQ